MDFENTLKNLKKEIDRALEKYLSASIKETAKKDKETAVMLNHAAKIILSGGKRIRPILMYFGYAAAGGQDKQKIIQAAIGIELIHNFFLIHDDIIDHGRKRHGIDTVDVFYGKRSKNIFSDCDPKHFGNSMAVIAGDLLQVLGMRAVAESNFEAKLIKKAIAELNVIIMTTIIGQIQDICLENGKRISEKEVLRMYENKTAKYTLEGPLKLGAILAGADAKFLRRISLFAIPVGMAFQIQDDILGLFETSQKIGKDSGSDIREGKKTLLVIEAIKKAGKEDREFLKKMLGNKKITKLEIKKFQEIINKTGSLEYNRNLAQKLIKDGKAEMKRGKLNPAAKDFLLDLADYMLKRKI